jgi:hypothetical protein
MRLSRTAIGLAAAAAATIAIAGLAVAWHNSPRRPTTVTFEPPYPQVNASGDPIRAVFEGRIPCSAPNCERRKVGLVLYEHSATRTPSTYWLGLIGLTGNDRIVIQGTWTIRQGVKDFPEAVVYELDASAPDDLQRHWRVSEDVLLPLDQSMRPLAGNAAWGYMLSRYDAPYGPRTYTLR